jgi:hypothetical protein
MMRMIQIHVTAIAAAVVVVAVVVAHRMRALMEKLARTQKIQRANQARQHLPKVAKELLTVAVVAVAQQVKM